MVAHKLDDLISSTFGRSRYVLVGRGTAALALALRALGLEGARVAVPASVCYAVPLAVELSGNVPVFLDADPSTGNVAVAELARREKPDAVVAVTTLYGAPLAMRDVAEWCEREGVPLIEDPSLAAGTEVDGRPAGGWGACAIVSFGHGKSVEAGNGAALLTDDAALAADVERLAQELPPYTAEAGAAIRHVALVYRELSRLARTEPQVHPLERRLFELHRDAFLYATPAGNDERVAEALVALPQTAERRVRVVAAYAEAFAATDLVAPLTPPDAPAWRYSLRARAGRDAAIERLWAEGEDASAWYPSVAPTFGDDSPYPGAEAIDREVVNLWLDGRDERAARATAQALLAALAEAA